MAGLSNAPAPKGAFQADVITNCSARRGARKEGSRRSPLAQQRWVNMQVQTSHEQRRGVRGPQNPQEPQAKCHPNPGGCRPCSPSRWLRERYLSPSSSRITGREIFITTTHCGQLRGVTWKMSCRVERVGHVTRGAGGIF